MLDRVAALFKTTKAASAPPPEREPSPSSPGGVAPAVVVACGAGVALWWWMQWMRSRETRRGTSEARLEEGADAAVPIQKGQAVERPPETPFV